MTSQWVNAVCVCVCVSPRTIGGSGSVREGLRGGETKRERERERERVVRAAV